MTTKFKKKVTGGYDLRIKSLTDNNTNRKTGGASERNEVTFITPKIKNITFAPTGRSLKTPEVDNSNRSKTFNTKATHSSTDHTSKYMLGLGLVGVAQKFFQLKLSVWIDSYRITLFPLKNTY